jgi:Squalene-hopene cyclase C-terminal domain
MIRTTVISLAVAAVSMASGLCGGDDEEPSEARIRSAVQHAIPLVEVATAGSADQRECFTCHHQAVPIIALTAADANGFKVDQENLERQIQRTITHLQRGYENYEQGKGQGGQVSTAGYALWALDAASWPQDETTAAVTHYLVGYQKKAKRWSQKSKRPPTSDSDFTATFLALKALSSYGIADQQSDIEERVSIVKDWLHANAASDTEDHVFRLMAVREIGADSQELTQAIDNLLSLQQDDGGWAQLPETKSDAYATATSLFALLTAAGLAPDDPQIHEGINYLLDTQQPDGTWHVVTRAEGFQPYFESGFPYDDDQFISMAASSWAMLALMNVLPDETAGDDVNETTAAAAKETR